MPAVRPLRKRWRRARGAWAVFNQSDRAGIPLPEPSTLTQCTADTFGKRITTNLDPYYRNVKAVRKTVLHSGAWLADEAERKNQISRKFYKMG